MSAIKRLVALKYGETYIDEGMAYRGGDRSKRLPISLIVYLLETDERKILVDAGCDTMPGFELSSFCSPVEVLGRLGIKADEITDLILTHAHHDHIEGVMHFTGATVYLQQAEYEKGKKYLPEGTPLVLFEEGLNLCPGVKIVTVGGHSRGSSVVEITDGTKTFVVCGDECYSPRCLEEGILTGSSVCPEKSRAFLQTYGTGEYIPLLCHQMPLLKS